jgi:alpha-tubulin suppressor-like RCC1 family protein
LSGCLVGGLLTLLLVGGVPAKANVQVARVSAISAGGTHSCALLGGPVKCWGGNGNGELGNGTTTQSSVPVAVSGITNAKAITAGGELDTHRAPETLIHSVPGGHTCALFSGGTIKCWGYNYYGQLGSGTYGDSATPVAVTGISGARVISAGADHVCTLVSGGKVECWGDAYEGQLGNGRNQDSTSPVTVRGIANATAISAGGDESCARLANGGVKCWGNNTDGQLGSGTHSKESWVPVVVKGIAKVTAVSVGYDHACARIVGGFVQCWGRDKEGQLGNGKTANSAVPVKVKGINNAIELTSGHSHTCARLSNGTVECWGRNSEGQLGNGKTKSSSVPVVVKGIKTAISITAGSLHTCALLSGGAVKCWGFGHQGQLGNGKQTSSQVPVGVSHLY